MSPAPKTLVEEDEIVDLFCVGSGPHSLAAVSRLLEPTPSALYSDVEHARLHWIRKHTKAKGKKGRVVPQDVVEGRAQLPTKDRQEEVYQRFQLEKGPKVVVMDKQKAGWLGTWDTLFNAFGITQLRSPMFFHPHPGDLDALKTYAQIKGRSKELVEISGVVGREWSKHQKKNARGRGVPPRQPHINLRDVSDYFTPSTKLFHDFIQEDVISRFSLNDIVQHGTVSSVRYLDPRSDRHHADGIPTSPSSPKSDVSDDEVDEPHFAIATADGRKFKARAVLMSIGPGGIPNVPSYLRDPAARTVLNGQGWCHTAAFLQPCFQFPPRDELALQKRICEGERPTVVIIGGGLTSAQIADMAIQKGCKVILVCRSHIKIKPFDIGNEWMGKFSNLFKMVFYQEDDPEARLGLIRQARGGGSITPPYHKILKAHVASGALEIRTLTHINKLTRDDDSRQWTIDIERRCEKKAPKVLKFLRPKRKGSSDEESTEEDCAACPHPEVDVQEGSLTADYIVSATGSLFDIHGLPFLKDMNKDFPIRSAGGMPILTEDLQWREDIPFFVMGGYAGLQLGPGAANLIGSREGSERVSNGLGAFFPDTWGEDAEWRATIQGGDAMSDDWRKERRGNCAGFGCYDVLDVQ